MDYSRSVNIDASPSLTFNALTQEVDSWWSSVEGVSDKEDMIFKVSFGPNSYWKFKVLKLNEPHEIVWQCVESHQDHNFKGIDKEWLNSKLYWNIFEVDGCVRVDFLHKGLLTTGICYEVCSSGWDFYIMESLKSLLENQEGKPGGR